VSEGRLTERNLDLERAHAKFKQLLESVILSDVHMRDQNDLRFLRQVKQQASVKSILFAFVSASNPDESERRNAKAFGASKLLTRHIEPQVRSREIEDCLQDGSN
jgi:CheY-like chemotaxis protein